MHVTFNRINFWQVSCFFIAVIALLASSSVFAKSLYHPNSYEGLVTDNRAHKVGDTITVLVMEEASALSATDSSNDGSTSFSADVSSTKRDHSGKLSLKRNYENGGEITRTGKLLARVTVTVTGVTSSGDYRVEGAQIITINKEKQTISVTGVVNKNSIRDNNTVMSTYLADMNLVYDGKGPLGKDRKPGLLVRILRMLF